MTTKPRSDGLEAYIDRDELARALARASTAVDRSGVHNASHVLIAPTEAGLQLTATDTEIAYTGTVAANIEHEGLRLTVEAKALLAVVRSLPEPTVRLAQVARDWLEIRSGAARFDLPAGQADAFPEPPPCEADDATTIEAVDLLRMVSQVAHAVSEDDARYGLNGAAMEIVSVGDEKRLRLVATDGHRAAYSETRVDVVPAIPPRLLVPRKALAAMRKLLAGGERVGVAFGDGCMRLSLASETLWFRLIDGEFPDYSAVLPTERQASADLSRDALVGAVDRATVLLGKQLARGIQLSLQETDTVALSVMVPDSGRLHETLPATVQGDAMTVQLAARFLADALAAMGGSRVVVELAGDLRPVLLRDPESDGALFVVMPQRMEEAP